MAERNRAMELYRFIAAALILCYHCQWVAFPKDGAPFSRCYLFVELFFILGGFLMMRSVRREYGSERCPDPAGRTVRYIKSRLDRLYPHHLLSWILVAALRVFLVRDLQPVQLARIGWPELLLVNIFGFVRGEYVNIVCWYISGLLFASLVIYYLLLRDEDGFVKILAPLILAVCYGTIYDRAENLAVTIVFTKYAPHLGFMRSLADITAGVLAYRVYEGLRDAELPGEAVLATLLELGVLASAGFWIFGTRGRLDFLAVPLFFLFVISVFRGKSLLTRLFDNRLSQWLGRQSYAFYLNNLAVVYLYHHFFPAPEPWRMVCVCVPACLLLSVITGKAVSLLTGRGGKGTTG